MRTITTSVFVDQKTAQTSVPPIVEHEGRPEKDSKKSGVYVGSVTTKVYEVSDWPTLTDAQRAYVFDRYATLEAATTANEYRAAIKDGGKVTAKRQLAQLNDERTELVDKVVGGDTSVLVRLGEINEEIKRLAAK